jgi:oligoribonuclease NrnB/cAMP/cGMP phosphodiesterase (DHH superfamily)
MKRILIHHVDLDGASVGVLEEVFREKLDFDDTMLADYGFSEDPNINEYVSSFDEIIIADLSLPEEHVIPWIERGKKVMIFDHHSETSWIQKYEGSVWDDSRCGTKIFWEEYVKPKVGRYRPIIDQYVDLVDTYDLWDQESPLWDEAVKLNNVLGGMKNYSATNQYEMFIPYFSWMEKKLRKLNEWTWLEKEDGIHERAVKREQDVYDLAMKRLQIRTDSKGKIFGLTVMRSKISLVASRILQEEENMDYLVVVNSYGGITGKLSFRSRNGFNCNDLEVANGHDAAAGGSIEPEDVVRFLDNPKLSFVYSDDFTEKLYEESA